MISANGLLDIQVINEMDRYKSQALTMLLARVYSGSLLKYVWTCPTAAYKQFKKFLSLV